MPSGDAGMSLSISGTGQLLLGTAYCPNRLASGQDWGKLRYSQTLWEGGWASQQLNHLCGPLWGLHCPRRPSQQQGWWQHTPSALLCALQRRDQLGSHCFPSGEVCAEETSLSTQANTQFNEQGWESGLPKWALYYQMYISALPTSTLILPTNITLPSLQALIWHLSYTPSSATSRPLKVRDLYFLRSLPNNNSTK